MEAIIIAVIGAFAGLSASLVSFVTFMISRYDKKSDKNSAEADMLLGLGHDRIVYLGSQYIARGYITKEEYENLHDYLYKPYLALGGNGTAQKIMKEVESLEFKERSDSV